MTFRPLAIVIAAALAGCAAPARMPTPAPASTAQPPAQLSQPYYQSVAELHQALSAGKTTSVEITRAFLARIKSVDQNGPKINSVIEVNPRALEIARKRDRARAAGEADGLLFGIPVMVKDNIDTRGPMLTTAGSLALAGAPAPQDATVVAKLRKAGAILIGKTNLSEWANFRSSYATSGWSGRGGLTKNPYVLPRNACGSSAGSGAAVTAGLVTVALGTETDGSIICPSSINGIVGIKPTLGLVSRAGIVPISHSQDTAGPMTRSVADAAAVLTAIAGSDTRDPATAEADGHATDYTQFVKPGALKGARIGVVCELAGFNPQVDEIMNESVAALRAAGATVLPVKLPHVNDYGKAEMTVLLYEFKHDLNAYLATRKGLAVHTLADLIAFNRTHADREMPWFGQDLFIKAQAKGPLTDETYRKALAKEKRLAGPEGIDAALAAHDLDVLMAPATGPAWVSDLVDGDNFGGAGYSPAAVAGYPSITVPAGNVHGLPVGMVFFAGKWSEPTLIGIGYGFEQATRARIRPQLEAHAALAAEVPTLAERNGAMAPAAAAAAGAPLCGGAG
ncbi:MAG TPA: amidase [Gammaproteobacteria bacterium]|nr:amidase [Gammaproteobacteria bacterium]HET7587784.1 amidase [Gammaproteobacteria bacterium]